MSNQPVAAAQIIISIVPIVGIVMAAVLIFFYLLWRHKQIMYKVQTKTYEPTAFNLSGFCLLSGIILVMTGAVLTILFASIEGVSYVLLGGLIPLSCGIALLFYYILTNVLSRKK